MTLAVGVMARHYTARMTTHDEVDPDLPEAEQKLLSDPDRLARVDAALADPDAAVPWTPRTQKGTTPTG